MKRIFLILIPLVVVGGVLFWLVENTHGSVLISTQHYIVQFSLWTALLLVLVVFVVLRLTYSALRAVLMPGWQLLASRQRRRHDRMRMQNNQGLLALAEGRWDVAKKDLLRTADKLDAPAALISYIAAANAAAQKGDLDDALQTLDMAEQSGVASGPAIRLTRARLFLDQKRYKEALALLDRLHSEYHNHPYVLSLLAQAYQADNQWDKLEELLPDLQRNNVLDKKEVFDWQVQIRSSQLRLLQESQEPNTLRLNKLEQLWSRVHKSVKVAPEVLGQYVRSLESTGERSAAESVLRRAISKNWDNDLVLLYGNLQGSDPMRKLVVAERWLRDQPDNADLLLTLGRLCKRNKLWGKGRDYLEASLNLNNRPETCAELALVMARLGEEKQSRQIFKRGLLESLGLEDDLLADAAK